MVAAGFGRPIERADFALGRSLGEPDGITSPGDWAATPVVGQRAVTIAPGQAQMGAITDPKGLGAKTDAATVQLPFVTRPGSMTHQGKLICRELKWYGIDQNPAGESSFVVVEAGDFGALPGGMPDWQSLVSIDSASGFVRLPGQRYLMPLHYAVVAQDSTQVRLWSLLRLSPLNLPGSATAGRRIGLFEPSSRYTGTFNFNGTGGGGNRAGLLEFTVPDPGVPFIAQIFGHFSGGSTSSAERVDFDAGYGGSNNSPLTGFLAPDYGVERPGRRFGRLDSPLSPVLTGAQTWRLTASRPLGGSADGVLDATPFRFQVEYTAAV